MMELENMGDQQQEELSRHNIMPVEYGDDQVQNTPDIFVSGPKNGNFSGAFDFAADSDQNSMQDGQFFDEKRGAGLSLNMPGDSSVHAPSLNRASQHFFFQEEPTNELNAYDDQ